MIVGNEGGGGAYLIITRRHVYAILMSPRCRYGLSVSLLHSSAIPLPECLLLINNNIIIIIVIIIRSFRRLVLRTQ